MNKIVPLIIQREYSTRVKTEIIYHPDFTDAGSNGCIVNPPDLFHVNG